MRLTVRMKTIYQSQNKRRSAPQLLELMGTGTRQAPGPSETPSRGSDQWRWRECRRTQAKWIEHIPASDPPRIRVTSDNPNYSPYECLMDEINIIGRIRWYGRKV